LQCKKTKKKGRFKQSLKAFPGFCITTLQYKAFILLFIVSKRNGRRDPGTQKANRSKAKQTEANRSKTKKRSGSDRAIIQPYRSYKNMAQFKAIFKPFERRFYFMNNQPNKEQTKPQQKAPGRCDYPVPIYGTGIKGSAKPCFLYVPVLIGK